MTNDQGDICINADGSKLVGFITNITRDNLLASESSASRGLLLGFDGLLLGTIENLEQVLTTDAHASVHM